MKKVSLSLFIRLGVLAVITVFLTARPTRGFAPDTPSAPRWHYESDARSTLVLISPQGQVLVRLENQEQTSDRPVPASQVSDRRLKATAAKYGLGFLRQIRQTDSFLISETGSYGIVIHRRSTSSPFPEYARDDEEKAEHPWPQGVDFDALFSPWADAVDEEASVDSSVVIFDNSGSEVFRKAFAGTKITAGVDDANDSPRVLIGLLSPDGAASHRAYTLAGEVIPPSDAKW